MAEIVDQLRLDISQALQDVTRLESALDRAVAPIEVRVDTQEADQLADTLREVQRIAERAATETQSIALAAGRAEVNFEDMARALDISEDEARRLTTELLETQAASNRVEDAARDIARQLGLSDNEAERLTRSLRQADTAAESINVTSGAMVSSFGSLRSAATGIASAFAVIGGAQLFTGLLRGANTAIQSFAQLEDSINAVNVVFRDGAGIALDFGETAAQAAGLSQEAFNNAVAPIGALLTNFGFEAREAADNAVVLIQRGADLASVYGGTVQEALIAINSALVGQVEPLRRFGAEISGARVEAFALATGLLQAGQEMDTATAVQARLGLILKDTAVVANDFVNTSEDLANAQRIAAAEAQNFGADVGEVLAPAMEVLVGLVPDLLEGLRQLVPGFANAADSAASFFDEINEGSGGFRAPLQALGAGLATVGDVFGGIGDQASFLFDTFTLEFGRAGEQVEQFNARLARTSQRIIGQNLARALDDGADSATAFGNAIAAFGRGNENIDVFANSFRTFAIQANLSGQELQFVTAFLIQNAEAAGFSAVEIQFLNEQLALLNDSLDSTDVGAQRAANRIREDLGEAFATIPTQFTTFTSGLAELPAQMDSVAIDIRASAAAVGEALNPFDDATEIIDVSAKEFFANLTAQINQQAEFQAGLARLVAAGFGDLAAEIAAQGPGAQRALDGFLSNLQLAQSAERLLDGEGTAVARQIQEELTAELASTTAAGDAGAVFAQFIEDGIFTNTQVQDAITTGSASSANRTITAYREALEAEGAAFDASFLAASIGAAIGASLDFSDAAAAAASATVNAYEQAFKDDFEISSPSKLMMRLGEEVAAGFLEGAELGDLQLRAPAAAISGAINPVGGVSGGAGVNINLTTVNPTQQDQVSDVARMGQIASSIANSWRSVVPNGM